MKYDQKNPIYPSVLVSCMFKQANMMFITNEIKHLKWQLMSLNFESLVQISSNPSVLSCISPIHSFCHVSCMHHIVAYCLVMFVYRCSLRQVLPPRRTTYPNEEQNQCIDPSGKQLTIWSYRYNPMFSLLLSFTALRQRVSNCCVLR